MFLLCRTVNLEYLPLSPQRRDTSTEPMKTSTWKRRKPPPATSFVCGVLTQRRGLSLIFIVPDLLHHRVSLEGSSHDRKMSSPTTSHPGEWMRPTDETLLSPVAWQDSVREDERKEKQKAGAILSPLDKGPPPSSSSCELLYRKPIGH